MKIRLSCRKLNVSISSLNYHTKFNANEKKKLSKGLITSGQLSFAPGFESSNRAKER